MRVNLNDNSHPSDGYCDDPDFVEPPFETTDTDTDGRNVYSHPSDGYCDDPDFVEPPPETTDKDTSDVRRSGRDCRPEIVDSGDAYDEARLRRLCSHDVCWALEFETDFKATFGLAWADEEVRWPVNRALQRALDLQEDGSATPLGMVAAALKELLKGHLRAFGRYYSGKDPWPRPSSVVKAEIDEEMPFALDWLRVELKEAIEMEREIAPVSLSF